MQREAARARGPLAAQATRRRPPSGGDFAGSRWDASGQDAPRSRRARPPLRPRGSPNPDALAALAGDPNLAAAALFATLEVAVIERARHLQAQILAAS